jgi:hypothetical protein
MDENDDRGTAEDINMFSTTFDAGAQPDPRL